MGKGEEGEKHLLKGTARELHGGQVLPGGRVFRALELVLKKGIFNPK
ncbi:MAG: hypothetical protein J7J32_06435 [Candidatus Atribacteria bacterium]|nr:hypothetical protein [Candidatus Atribacteria bacterium]MCD6350437.1 hypothetical protein [Candidatus Atribacteria bacterium]